MNMNTLNGTAFNRLISSWLPTATAEQATVELGSDPTLGEIENFFRDYGLNKTIYAEVSKMSPSSLNFTVGSVNSVHQNVFDLVNIYGKDTRIGEFTVSKNSLRRTKQRANRRLKFAEAEPGTSDGAASDMSPEEEKDKPPDAILSGSLYKNVEFENLVPAGKPLKMKINRRQRRSELRMKYENDLRAEMDDPLLPTIEEMAGLKLMRPAKDTTQYNIGTPNVNIDTRKLKTIWREAKAINGVIDAKAEFAYKEFIPTGKCYQLLFRAAETPNLGNYPKLSEVVKYLVEAKIAVILNVRITNVGSLYHVELAKGFVTFTDNLAELEDFSIGAWYVSERRRILITSPWYSAATMMFIAFLFAIYIKYMWKITLIELGVIIYYIFYALKYIFGWLFIVYAFFAFSFLMYILKHSRDPGFELERLSPMDTEDELRRWHPVFIEVNGIEDVDNYQPQPNPNDNLVYPWPVDPIPRSGSDIRGLFNINAVNAMNNVPSVPQQAVPYGNDDQKNFEENFRNRVNGNVIPYDCLYEIVNQFKYNRSDRIVRTRPHISKPISLPKLGPKAAEWLINNSRGFNVAFDSDSNTLHPYAFIFRALSLEYMKKETPPGVKVLVVGSAVSNFSLDGFTHVIPHVESRDANRNNAKRTYIKGLLKRGKTVEYIPIRMEMVKGRYDIIYSNHSAYDIPIRSFMKHAYRLGVKRVYVSLMMNLSLFEDDFGVLPANQMRFEKYAIEGEIRVKMFHLAQTGEAYDHNWKTYKEWFSVRSVRVHNKFTYYGEVVQEFPDNVVLCFTLGPHIVTFHKELQIHNYHAPLCVELCVIPDSLESVYLPWQSHTVNVSLVSETLYSNIMSNISNASKDPNPDTVRANSLNIAKNWENEHFHPYFIDYMDKVEDIGKITRTLTDLNGWFKWIRKTETGAIGMIIGPWFAFTNIIDAILPESLGVLRARKLTSLFYRKLVSEKKFAALAIDITKKTDQITNGLDDNDMLPTINPAYINLRGLIKTKTHERNSKVKAMAYNAREYWATARQIGCCRSIKLFGRIQIVRLYECLRYRWMMGDDRINTATHIETLLEEARVEAAQRREEERRQMEEKWAAHDARGRKLKAPSAPADSQYDELDTDSPSQVADKPKKPVAALGIGGTTGIGTLAKIEKKKRVSSMSPGLAEEIDELSVIQGPSTNPGAGGKPVIYPRSIQLDDFTSINRNRSTNATTFASGGPNVLIDIKDEEDKKENKEDDGISTYSYGSNAKVPTPSVRIQIEGGEKDGDTKADDQYERNKDDDFDKYGINYESEQESEIGDMPTGFIISDREPDPDETYGLFGKDMTRLGQASNDQSYSILYQVPGICYQQGRYGLVARPILDDFISCMAVNPDRVYSWLTIQNVSLVDAIDNIMYNNPIIMIHNNCYGYHFDLSTVKYSEVIMIEYTNGKFARMPETDEKTDPVKLLTLKGLTYIGYEYLSEFTAISNSFEKDPGAPFCFYKATMGKSYNNAVGQNETYCLPEKIVELSWKTGTAIVNKGVVYMPPQYFLHEVSFVYVVGNHCLQLNKTRFIQFATLFNYINVNFWTQNLNGIIEREKLLNEVENNIILNLPTAIANELSSLSNYKIGDIIRNRPYDIPEVGPRVKSVTETIMYNIYLERSLLRKYDLVTKDGVIKPDRALSGHYIYDKLSNKFINQKPDKLLLTCWDGEDFVTCKYNEHNDTYNIPSQKRFFIFGEDLEFLRERSLIDKIFNEITEILTYDYESIEITLINGVPGCGKTYEIINTHIQNVDMVLTATKEANNDYRKLPNSDKRYYRTYDSVILNEVPECDKVYADEGLMVHAGDLLLCARKIGAKEVCISGDSLQIPFINRAIGFTMKYHILTLNKIEHRNITYRCPQSMMPILRQFYPEIRSKSKIIGTIGVVKIKIPTIVDYDIVLCFTQYEKSELRKMTSIMVKTIHEVQGKVYNKVALVRLIIQANAIYDSQPHIIVGISRHRKDITYYTVDDKDTTSKLLRGEAIEVKLLRNELESQLRPVNYPRCFAPLMRRKYINLKSTDRIETRVGQFIQNKNFYNAGYLVYNEIKVWEIIEPEGNEKIGGIDKSDIQLIMDTLYDRIDPVKYDILTHKNVFPLPEEFQIKFDKAMSITPKNEVYLKPVLLTPAPERSKGTLLDVVEAVQKRNLNPPIVHLNRDPKLVSEIVDRFMEIYIDSEKLQLAKAINNYSNGIYFETWLAKRTGTQMGILDGYEMKDYNANKYNSHLKPDAKPAYDNSHNMVRPAGQVVTAHNPIITAMLSGIMGCFTIILKTSLKEKWMINDGYNLVEISGFMNRILQDTDSFIPQEVDFSKFDKSQEEIVLLCNCEILRRLGVPEYWVKYWYDCHVNNTLIFHKLGIKVKTLFQRRSGDILTFVLNTLTAMLVLAYTHEYEEAFGGIFGGDDSLVCLFPTTKLFDQSKHIANIFNLNAKLEYFPNGMYFSSKFLIFVEYQWLFIPDPIKAIFRLGRDDLFCKEHIELYYISYCDNMKWYKNHNVRREVNNAVRHRYKSAFKRDTDVTLIINYLTQLIDDKKEFLSLFTGPRDIWNRKLPKAMLETFLRFEYYVEELDW